MLVYALYGLRELEALLSARGVEAGICSNNLDCLRDRETAKQREREIRMRFQGKTY